MTTALPRHLSLFGLCLLVVNGLTGAGMCRSFCASGQS